MGGVQEGEGDLLRYDLIRPVLPTPPVHRSVLSLLATQPNLSSVRQDLLPFLTQQQLRLRPPMQPRQQGGEGADGEAGSRASESGLPGSSGAGERGAGHEGDNDHGAGADHDLPGGCLGVCCGLTE